MLGIAVWIVVGFGVGLELHGEAGRQPSSIGAAAIAHGSPSTASEGSSSVQADAPASLRQVLELRDDFSRSAALFSLASTVDAQGLERLLDEAAGISQPSVRTDLTSILYMRYAAIDPEAGVAHILRRGDPGEIHWIASLFNSWALNDYPAALARAAKLDEDLRTRAVASILRARADLPRKERMAIGEQYQAAEVYNFSSFELRTAEDAQWGLGTNVSARHAWP